MKKTFYGFCLISVIISGLVFYFALQRVLAVNTVGFPMPQTRGVSEQNSPSASSDRRKVKTVNKKQCACCREKLAPSKKVAEQRLQARKAWAREMFANYGYEEGMKRIAAKDPGLAKQIQQILERKKQPNLAPSVAQSSSQ